MSHFSDVELPKTLNTRLPSLQQLLKENNPKIVEDINSLILSKSLLVIP